MLRKIRLKNFKLHEDTSIEASRITVFIGPNNSGKSSVFQALLALRQAALRGDGSFCKPSERNLTSPDQPFLFPHGEVIDLGEFGRVLRQGHEELEIGFSGEQGLMAGDSSSPKVKVEVRVTIRENALVSHSGTLDLTSGALRWEWFKGTPARTPQLSLGIDGVELHFSPTDRFGLIGMTGYGPASPEGSASATRFGQPLAETVPRFLSSVHPVFPTRGFEEWGYPLRVRRPGNLEGISLSDRALALATLFPYDRALEEQVSKTLEDLLGIRIWFQLVEPLKVIIWARRVAGQDPDTLFSNEGTGANQLPFILVPIALAEPGETILLSEPEAHLHPKAQSQLTAMLLEVSRKADLQFFIETHSEHVLHRLLHAVAKGELSKDELAIYYFKEPVDGVAHAERLAVNEHGQVEGGLPGFFEQSLTELTDYLDALKKT